MLQHQNHDSLVTNFGLCCSSEGIYVHSDLDGKLLCISSISPVSKMKSFSLCAPKKGLYTNVGKSLKEFFLYGLCQSTVAGNETSSSIDHRHFVN